MATTERLTAQREHNRRYRARLRENGRPTRNAVAMAFLDRVLASSRPDLVLEAAHVLCSRGFDDTEVLALLAGMVAQAKTTRAAWDTDVDTSDRVAPEHAR